MPARPRHRPCRSPIGWGAMLVEGSLPILLFLPWKRDVARTLAVLLATGFQLSKVLLLGHRRFVERSCHPLIGDRIDDLDRLRHKLGVLIEH